MIYRKLLVRNAGKSQLAHFPFLLVRAISSNPNHFRTIHLTKTVLPLFEKLINLVKD
jgi:hypothetical protein